MQKRAAQPLQRVKISPTPETERGKAFAWFDSLGYTDVTRFPLAKVYNGGWSEKETGKRVPSYEYGFVTESDKIHFSLCWFNLWTERLTFASRTAQTEPVSFEPVDLQSYVQSQLKPRAENSDSNFPYDSTLPLKYFILARACEGKGLSALAEKLYRFSEDALGSPDAAQPKLSFTERIAEEIARYEIWNLMVRIGDPAISRETLLAQFQAFLQRFPHSKYRDTATDTVTELKRMVIEDRYKAAQAVARMGSVSQKRRIADLIFALRDQNGRQWSQPGQCDIFLDPRQEQSPASQLVKIGLPAVPALLEAMTDSRLTRSVGFWRGYYFSHHVLRVGDAAKTVLETIAHRSFESSLDSKKTSTWKEAAASFQRAVRKWWAQIQIRGEMQVLRDAVSRGDTNAVGQADRLVSHYPNVALPALKQGIAHADSDGVRQDLVKIVGDLHRPAVIPVLKRQLRHGQDRGTRVQAALALNQRGDPEAIVCMIREWRHNRSSCEAGESLLRFLVGCGSPEAIRVLGEGLSRRDVETRVSVVMALDDKEAGYAESRSSASSPGGDSTNRVSRAAAAQSVLVSLLRDREVRGGMMMGIGDYSFRDPRVCDIANSTLAYLWPHMYRYHHNGSRYERDYECIEMINQWRLRNGLAALPLPSRPYIRPVSFGTLQERRAGIGK